MGTRANTISDQALRAKWRGKDRWFSDGGSRGAGRLVAKLSQSGTTFYFAYFDAEAKRRFLPIGPHDSTGKRGIALQRARDRAAEALGALSRRRAGLARAFRRAAGGSGTGTQARH